MQSPTISTEASGEGWGLLRGGDAPGEQVRSAVLLDGMGLQTKLVALERARPNGCRQPWRVDGAVRGCWLCWAGLGGGLVERNRVLSEYSFIGRGPGCRELKGVGLSRRNRLLWRS